MSKAIKTPEDITLFTKMNCYRELIQFIEGLSNAVIGQPLSSLPTLEKAHTIIHSLNGMLTSINAIIDGIPLQDVHLQRFGNKAFREFHHALQQQSSQALQPVIETSVKTRATLEKGPATVSDADLEASFKPYLLDSFGNPTRIDYGTGHELHFVILLLVICKVSFGSVDSIPAEALKALVGNTFVQYIGLMRRLQAHYLLEPAGTHGVWGLDDYHHFPFILGAAQLRGRESEFPPKSIVERVAVASLKDEYIYFSMIDWILRNKKGPFHEHSSILFNVSGVETWEKTHIGMIKMYIGEVLTKRNIVQHLLFTPLFPFE